MDIETLNRMLLHFLANRRAADDLPLRWSAQRFMLCRGLADQMGKIHKDSNNAHAGGVLHHCLEAAAVLGQGTITDMTPGRRHSLVGTMLTPARTKPSSK